MAPVFATPHVLVYTDVVRMAEHLGAVVRAGVSMKPVSEKIEYESRLLPG